MAISAIALKVLRSSKATSDVNEVELQASRLLVRTPVGGRVEDSEFGPPVSVLL